MSELNTNTPIVYCNLRAEYLYNGTSHHGEFIPCAIFGASSVQGRAIGFHCMLNNGALIYRLPISAFVHKVDAPDLPLDFLQLWDCFSHQMTCIEYEFLRGMRVDVTMKDRVVLPGIYLFTLDWYGNSLSDNPGEGGHKCAHIIQLNNGCFAAQPNNRIRWFEPSFITAPFPARPDYQTNNRVFSCENKGPKWCTEDTERLFYDIVEEPPCPNPQEVFLSQPEKCQRLIQELNQYQYQTESPSSAESVPSMKVTKESFGEKDLSTQRPCTSEKVPEETKESQSVPSSEVLDESLPPF